MSSRSRLHRLEALAPLFLLLLFGLVYNEVGELAESRGVNHAGGIETRIDGWVPFWPIFIVPYSAFWGLPVAVFGYLYWKLGWEPTPYRGIFVTLVSLIVGCVGWWLWFPVRVGSRAGEVELASHGFLGELVSATYLAATPWNACPSFHAAGAWILFRTVQFYVARVPRLIPVLVILIIASTVLIHIHYLLDIAFGLLLSELAFRLILRRVEGNDAFARWPSSAALAAEWSVLLAGVAGYLILLRI